MQEQEPQSSQRNSEQEEKLYVVDMQQPLSKEVTSEKVIEKAMENFKPYSSQQLKTAVAKHVDISALGQGQLQLNKEQIKEGPSFEYENAQ